MKSTLHTVGAQEIGSPLSIHPPLASFWHPSLVLEEGSQLWFLNCSPIPLALGTSLPWDLHFLPAPMGPAHCSVLSMTPLNTYLKVCLSLPPRCLSLEWEGGEHRWQGHLQPDPQNRPSESFSNLQSSRATRASSLLMPKISGL